MQTAASGKVVKPSDALCSVRSDTPVTSSFLLLLVRHLLLEAMPFVPSSVLATSFLLLVVRPGAPSSDM